jgi:hypothetical protein
MSAKVWQEGLYVIEKKKWSGTKKLNGTIDNAAAVDHGTGMVRIPITAHGMTAGNMIRIAGSVAYNGIWTITSVDTNYIVITTTYVAETFAGTETYTTAFQIDPTTEDYMLVEARLTLSAASAAENYVIAIDSGDGAAWDCTLETNAMSGLLFKDSELMSSGKRKYLDGDDIVLFTHANSNNRTWGLELVYRRYA